MNQTKSYTPSLYRRLSFTPWLICLLAAVYYSYDFLLRVQPNVMVDTLMSVFHTDAAGIGLLSAFYYYVYTPLQIPAGLVADKYNIRYVLTLSAAFCALGAILFATVHTYAIALLARLLMGAGSAFVFVCTLKLASRWIPNFFSFFVGITTTLGTMGAMITNIALPRMIEHYGWHDAILFSGYLGCILTVIILLLIRNHPNKRRKLTQQKRDWKTLFMQLSRMLRKPVFWINGGIGCFLFTPISVFAALWGNSFLQSAYGMSVTNASSAIALIFFGNIAGAPIMGWLTDYLNNRKHILYVGTALTLAFSSIILFCTGLPHLVLYTLLFLLGFSTGAQVIIFSIAREISPPKSTGTATAFSNCIVTISAAVLQPLIGYLLVLFWSGTSSPAGIAIYSTADHQQALVIIPILLLVTLFLIAFLPETGKYQLQQTPSSKKPI